LPSSLSDLGRRESRYLYFDRLLQQNRAQRKYGGRPPTAEESRAGAARRTLMHALTVQSWLRRWWDGADAWLDRLGAALYGTNIGQALRCSQPAPDTLIVGH